MYVDGNNISRIKTITYADFHMLFGLQAVWKGMVKGEPNGTAFM